MPNLPPTLVRTIDTMATAYTRALHQMRQFTPMIAMLHERRSPREDELRAATLAVCTRLIVPLRQLRNAIDDQLAAIEGTWQPPQH